MLSALEILRAHSSGSIYSTRLLAVLITGVLLTATVLIREYFVQRGFLDEIGLMRDQLQLAMQCGKSIAWDLDVASWQGAWFGDLERFFGIKATTYGGRAQEFAESVHPEDRRSILQAITDAVKNRKPFAAVFRLLLPAGGVMSNWYCQLAALFKGCFCPVWGPEPPHESIGVTAVL